MNRRSFAAALIVLVPVGLLSARLKELEPAATNIGAEGKTVSTLADRDVQISVWRKALTADSGSAIALGMLAGLYVQRGRESGDESNYAEAEAYARRSVGLRTNRNGAAFVTLASALLTQHRFVEADSIATKLVSLEPDIPQYRSMLGEISLELGDYDRARSLFDSLRSQRTHLSIAPRLARWMELNGESDAARKLLYSALAEAKRRRDLPREQLAWFHLRVGDIEMRSGRLRGARSEFEAGLHAAPGDYRLLAAMSRLEAVQGHPSAAIDFGERSMAIKLDPATLGTIGDAWAQLGDTAQAEDYFKTMEVAVAGQPGAYHRAWSLFLLDHDRRVGEVLANVGFELETRRDIYGYDLLAWALHKSGRNAEARDAMAMALRMGTQDAMLFYHAGMIERGLGDKPRARHYLERALAINPWFHPTQSREARAALAVMPK
ncbi:MAG: tetratricopeptide repeat protein [Gemmatimonadales bacterium]